MIYTIREFRGTGYGEAQKMGEGNGSLEDIRAAAKRFFSPTRVGVSRKGNSIKIRGKYQGLPFVYGIFVEPHTHPDN